MNDCPSAETLEQLLAGQSTDSEAEVLDNHIRGCLACQALLERLSDVAELRQWRPLRGRAQSSPDPGPQLARVMRQLSASPCPEPDALNDYQQRLSFLGPAPSPGDLGTLGPYVVQSELGRGGMGIVLRAHDETLQRTVALKVLRPAMADPGRG